MYRALFARKQIDTEARDLTFATGRIVGFTKEVNALRSDVFDYYAVVEYENPEHEVIWAETQHCDRRDFDVEAEVKILCRPQFPRSVRMMPDEAAASRYVRFEKNFLLLPSFLGILILFGVALRYHGFAIHILGPLLAMLGAGLAVGYATKGRDRHAEEREAGTTGQDATG